MTRALPIAFLRHGPTAANRAHRLQGRADWPLDPTGRAAVAAWRLPPAVTGFRWFTSPLRRCRETAELLGLEATPDARLIEMDWGAWEGRSVAELRAAEPGLTAAEAQGLDLTPPGGESPRDVQVRLREFFRALPQESGGIGIVSHKGVIRAALADATGWDMQGKPPIRLDWAALQLFSCDPTGKLAVDRLNLSMLPG